MAKFQERANGGNRPCLVRKARGWLAAQYRADAPCRIQQRVGRELPASTFSEGTKWRSRSRRLPTCTCRTGLRNRTVRRAMGKRVRLEDADAAQPLAQRLNLLLHVAGTLRSGRCLNRDRRRLLGLRIGVAALGLLLLAPTARLGLRGAVVDRLRAEDSTGGSRVLAAVVPNIFSRRLPTCTCRTGLRNHTVRRAMGKITL